MAQRLQRVEVFWLLLLLFAAVAVDDDVVVVDGDVVVPVDAAVDNDDEMSRLWPLSQISRY